jgi:hypothetical protein
MDERVDIWEVESCGSVGMGREDVRSGDEVPMV